MPKITHKYLLNKGYKEFKPNPVIHNHSIEKCYQKRFDDDIGKRYFIDVNQWVDFVHPYTKEHSGITYEYTTQLYKKGTHDALDLNFHCTWNLEDVEEYLEKMFETGMYDYYELF